MMRRKRILGKGPAAITTKQSVESAFLEAARSGNHTAVLALWSESRRATPTPRKWTQQQQLLGSSSLDANCCNANRCTALHLAAHYGHAEVVRVLVDIVGVDVWKRQTDEWLALHLAVHKNHLVIVQYLLSKDAALANALQPGGWTPLHLACQQGNLKLVECLVKHGAQINARKKFGVSPLHIACQEGFLSIVKYLIRNGAQVDARDDDGWTPLFVAVQNARVLVVQLLLESGARVGVTDNRHGSTPLHVASQRGFLPVVKLLVEHNVGAGDEFFDAPLRMRESSLTARQLALLKKHYDVVFYLDHVRKEREREIQRQHSNVAAKKRLVLSTTPQASAHNLSPSPRAVNSSSLVPAPSQSRCISLPDNHEAALVTPAYSFGSDTGMSEKEELMTRNCGLKSPHISFCNSQVEAFPSDSNDILPEKGKVEKSDSFVKTPSNDEIDSLLLEEVASEEILFSLASSYSTGGSEEITFEVEADQSARTRQNSSDRLGKWTFPSADDASHQLSPDSPSGDKLIPDEELSLERPTVEKVLAEEPVVMQLPIVGAEEEQLPTVGPDEEQLPIVTPDEEKLSLVRPNEVQLKWDEGQLYADRCDEERRPGETGPVKEQLPIEKGDKEHLSGKARNEEQLPLERPNVERLLAEEPVAPQLPTASPDEEQLPIVTGDEQLQTVRPNEEQLPVDRPATQQLLAERPEIVQSPMVRTEEQLHDERAEDQLSVERSDKGFDDNERIYAKKQSEKINQYCNELVTNGSGAFSDGVDSVQEPLKAMVIKHIGAGEFPPTKEVWVGMEVNDHNSVQSLESVSRVDQETSNFETTARTRVVDRDDKEFDEDLSEGTNSDSTVAAAEPVELPCVESRIEKDTGSNHLSPPTIVIEGNVIDDYEHDEDYLPLALRQTGTLGTGQHERILPSGFRLAPLQRRNCVRWDADDSSDSSSSSSPEAHPEPSVTDVLTESMRRVLEPMGLTQRSPQAMLSCDYAFDGDLTENQDRWSGI